MEVRKEVETKRFFNSLAQENLKGNYDRKEIYVFINRHKYIIVLA